MVSGWWGWRMPTKHLRHHRDKKTCGTRPSDANTKHRTSMPSEVTAAPIRGMPFNLFTGVTSEREHNTGVVFLRPCCSPFAEAQNDVAAAPMSTATRSAWLARCLKGTCLWVGSLTPRSMARCAESYSRACSVPNKAGGKRVGAQRRC